jgi:two-component sensor histidine kinase
MALRSEPKAFAFLEAGAEMGALMRAHDWSTSPLGDPSQWPQSLKTTVSLMINSLYPMFVAWGPQLAFLYNDGYKPIFGAKHPHTLGLPFQQVWPEIWTDIEPLVSKALMGEATFHEHMHLVMERNGYPEDTWYTFSYSPVRDETGEVAGMFCACQETTGQILAERRLESQAERYQNLFQSAPGFIGLLRSSEHIYEFVNDAYIRLMGDRDYIGRSVREVVPEAVEQDFIGLLDHVYQTGETYVAYATPLKVSRPFDGVDEERFLDFIYQPVRDADGTITGIFVEGHDVTQGVLARHAQDNHARHLELLNDELNHRVKNTLAIVQGLAHQTFKGDGSTPAAKAAFEGRLTALASAHNILVRENWEPANLSDLVSATQKSHAIPSARWTITGPPVRLPPQQAVTLAMALHELATNARKYGALATGNGQVDVIWRLSEDDCSLLIKWMESGGPLVVLPTKLGFGSRMIERALGAELGGEVSLTFDPSGVVCQIELPLVAVRKEI